MRLFIAVNLEKKLKERLSGAQDALRTTNSFNGSYPASQNLHFTLQFLGDVNEKKIKEIEDVLSEVKLEPFKVKIKGFGVFPSENYIRVVWIGIEDNQMSELAKQVTEKLRPLGYKPDYKFSAHLTLARVKFANNKAKLIKFVKDNKEKEFGIFEIKSFELMSSKLSPKGARYDIIKSFEL